MDLSFFSDHCFTYTFQNDSSIYLDLINHFENWFICSVHMKIDGTWLTLKVSISLLSLFFCSPSTMASICVAFRSFCCDSLPLTLSLVVPHFSLLPLRPFHPSHPLMPSSRVAGRGVRADLVTDGGRTGATEMESEIPVRGEWDAVWGAGRGARLCSVWGRNWPGSTSRGWTTASFTRVWHREGEMRLLRDA